MFNTVGEKTWNDYVGKFATLSDSYNHYEWYEMLWKETTTISGALEMLYSDRGLCSLYDLVTATIGLVTGRLGVNYKPKVKQRYDYERCQVRIRKIQRRIGKPTLALKAIADAISDLVILIQNPEGLIEKDKFMFATHCLRMDRIEDKKTDEKIFEEVISEAKAKAAAATRNVSPASLEVQEQMNDFFSSMEKIK